MFRCRATLRKYKISKLNSSCKYLNKSLTTSAENSRYLKPVSAELEDKYISTRIENGWARQWADFESVYPSKNNHSYDDDGDNQQAGRLFKMVLPPPNITGDLHLGHAMTVSIEDAICRYRRLHRDRVLWIPGTDHAGIATQAVLERKIAKESENDVTSFSRNSEQNKEHRLKVAADWKLQKETRILQQLSRMGASLNWSRKLFTMDSTMSAGISEAFVRLYERGLIYRNKRLINWCNKLQSTLSDIEIDYVDVQPNQKIEGVNMGCMHNVAYPIYGGKSEAHKNEVVVSTGRLETMLADVAVAVHPEDERYSHLEHLKTLLEHPLTGRKLILIKDSQVDMKVGTGAVKITPAYSKIDWELCQRHGIHDFVECFDDHGRITVEGFQVDSRASATHKIKAKLDQLGLYRGVNPVARSIPICSRTGCFVDQRLRPQWYLKCDDLARRALEEVESGRVKMIPGYHKKIWRDWMSKSQDWCISRQLWWGHRIPAYRLPSPSNEGSELWIVTTNEQALPSGAVRDPDVLDTWFSSALYPLIAFGWPKVARPAPLDILETGHDILKFWVARMMFISLALTDQTPFNTVVLHGLLRDANGQKMSKSLGNAIDPLHIIEGASLQELHEQTEKLFSRGYLSEKEKNRAIQQTRQLFPKGVVACGADALRIALLRCDIHMENVSFDTQKVVSARNFCNKIWQGVRFYQRAAMINVIEYKTDSDEVSTPDEFDKWILARLHNTQETVKLSFENFTTHNAVHELERFWVTGFCDVYLEIIKPDVWNVTSCLPRRVSLLREIIDTFLIIASPFMPYLTEELHHKLQLMTGIRREECSSIQSQKWPNTEKWRNNHVLLNTTEFVESLSRIRMVKQREGLSSALKILDEMQLSEGRMKMAYLLCKIKPEQTVKPESNEPL